MNRSRITITIKNDLLKDIDGLIDGTKIKNRSHAIESVLSREFSGKIRKAVILAGGEGIKIAGKKYKVSRVLAPFEGGTFIGHILPWLHNEGIEEVIICGDEYSDGIKEAVGDGGRFGLRVSYIGKDGGTADVLRRLSDKIEGTFLMMNGDVLIKTNLEELLDFHRKCQGDCTVGMISVQKPAAFGNILLRGNCIIDFIEKPRAGREESYLASAGIYIMEHGIINKVSAGCKSLEKDLFPLLAKEGGLRGYFIQDKWIRVKDLKNFSHNK